MRIFAAIILTLVLMTSVRAETPVLRIDGDGDRGGSIEGYYTSLKFLRMLGASVEISAECTSACVMILRIFPHERICIRPGARIGLHQVARIGPKGKFQYDPRVTTEFVKQFYPPWIADWVAKHGPLKPAPIYIEFAELKQHYRECGPA